MARSRLSGAASAVRVQPADVLTAVSGLVNLVDANESAAGESGGAGEFLDVRTRTRLLQDPARRTVCC